MKFRPIGFYFFLGLLSGSCAGNSSVNPSEPTKIPPRVEVSASEIKSPAVAVSEIISATPAVPALRGEPTVPAPATPGPASVSDIPAGPVVLPREAASLSSVKPSATRPARAWAFLPISKLDSNPTASIGSVTLSELSGLIPASEKGHYWGHNDKGNDPELFRFDREGNIRQRVTLMGITNEDWEAITRDAAGHLYIGGFGDNSRKRESYTIYQLPEPPPQAVSVEGFKTIPYRYADGRSHNCEALFYFDGRLYMITKVNPGKEKEKEKKKKDPENIPQVFCLDDWADGERIIARHIGPFKVQDTITDAAYSSRYGLLAVLSYTNIYFFRMNHEKDLLAAPAHTVSIDVKKSEGLCFDADSLLVTNEQGQIWKYPLNAIIKIEPGEQT